MSHNQISDPPINWVLGVSELNPGIYYKGDTAENMIIWHWCNIDRYWSACNVSNHKIISLFPLTLDTGLLFDCCGLQGQITDGRWVSA